MANTGKRKSLGNLIGALKTVTTGRMNLMMGYKPGTKIWQRNFYEQRIRNDAELYAVRRYIIDNPNHWEHDRFHE